MRLSRTAYYADFGIYALIVAGTIVWGITWRDPTMQLKALAAAVSGCGVWTLVEYALHRFVFHGVSWIGALHARHHAEPRAFIGTPTWLSAGVIAVFILLPTWFAFSRPVAAGFSAGFVLAYLWYGIAHHLIHHSAPSPLARLLHGTAKRHFRHHGCLEAGNFGLTTDLWDRIFATRLAARAPGAPRMYPNTVNGADRTPR